MRNIGFKNETNDFLNHIKQIYEFNNLNLRFND